MDNDDKQNTVALLQAHGVQPNNPPTAEQVRELQADRLHRLQEATHWPTPDDLQAARDELSEEAYQGAVEWDRVRELVHQRTQTMRAWILPEMKGRARDWQERALEDAQQLVDALTELEGLEGAS